LAISLRLHECSLGIIILEVVCLPHQKLLLAYKLLPGEAFAVAALLLNSSRREIRCDFSRPKRQPALQEKPLSPLNLNAPHLISPMCDSKVCKRVSHVEMSPIVLDKDANRKLPSRPTSYLASKRTEEEINMGSNDDNISSYRPFHIDPVQFDMFPYDLQDRLYRLGPLHQWSAICNPERTPENVGSQPEQSQKVATRSISQKPF
jgi:hypothetical protein